MKIRPFATCLLLGLATLAAAEIRWEEGPEGRTMIRLEDGQEVYRKVYPRPGPGGGVDRGHLKGAILDQVAAPPEQGSIVTCVYCTRIRPGLGAACPRCKGDRTRFKAARMLDGASSRREVLGMLAAAGEAERALAAADPAGRAAAARALVDRLVGVRAAMDLYGFDLGLALEECVRDLEDEHGLR